MKTNAQRNFLWFIMPFLAGWIYWISCAFMQITTHNEKALTTYYQEQLQSFTEEQYQQEVLESSAIEFLTEQEEYDALVSFNDDGYGYTHIINFDNIVYSL